MRTAKAFSEAPLHEVQVSVVSTTIEGEANQEMISSSSASASPSPSPSHWCSFPEEQERELRHWCEAWKDSERGNRCESQGKVTVVLQGVVRSVLTETETETEDALPLSLSLKQKTLSEHVRTVTSEGDRADYYVPSASPLSAFIGHLLLDRPGTTVMVPAHAWDHFKAQRSWAHNVVVA